MKPREQYRRGNYFPKIIKVLEDARDGDAGEMWAAIGKAIELIDTLTSWDLFDRLYVDPDVGFIDMIDREQIADDIEEEDLEGRPWVEKLIPKELRELPGFDDMFKDEASRRFREGEAVSDGVMATLEDYRSADEVVDSIWYLRASAVTEFLKGITNTGFLTELAAKLAAANSVSDTDNRTEGTQDV